MNYTRKLLFSIATLLLFIVNVNYAKNLNSAEFDFKNDNSSFYDNYLSNWKNVKDFNSNTELATHNVTSRKENVSRENKVKFTEAAYMAASFVGSETNCNNNGNTTSINVNVPNGSINDILIASVSTDDDASAINTPSGWILLESAFNNNTALSVFYRLANGSEPNSYNFSLASGSDEMCAAIVRYSGVNTTNPIDGSNIATGNSNNPNPPAITTSTNNATIVNIIGVGDNVSPVTSSPSGTTLRVDIESDQNSLAVSDQNQSNSGNINPGTWNLPGGNDDRWIAVTLGINTTPNVDPCDALASGNLDTDGDNISDICDLDDDNDGILDTDESAACNGISNNLDITGNFGFGSLGSGNNGTYPTTLNGTTYTATFVENGSSISTVNLNGANQHGPSFKFNGGTGDTGSIDLVFSNAIEGAKFKLTDFDQREIVTVEAYDNNNNLIALGGNGSIYLASVGSQINQNGNTFTEPDTNNNVDGDSENSDNLGAITFNFAGISIKRVKVSIQHTEGSSIRYKMINGTFCSATDTDKDGIIDTLDTDSDNDGCPDALEAAGNFTASQLATLNGGSSGGSSLNFGTNVNANGIPTTAASSSTTGQATNTAVTTAEQITVSNSPANQTINQGANATFSVTATGKITTTFNAGTPDYNAGTNSTVSYKWYKNSAPNTTLSTTSSLNLTNVMLADDGEYSVLISGVNNSCGEVRSATLNVNAVDPCTDGATFGVVTANDPDADGINNICDLDDDNDGILDSEECQTLIGEKAFFLDNPNDVETFNLPPVGNGFVLDITSIDNSFNLTINGTPLISRTVSGGAITNELEFQTNGTLGQNVRFVSDQATHGTNGIQQIWQFDNINNTVVNEETPIIRVIVDENLNVTIYGSRTPNGPLEEMELFNGATFNNFTWNSLSPNTFVLDQAEVGATYIIGRVYGTFTDCDTDGDGINNNLDLDSDGDGCLDVVESGGIDANNDGKLDGTGISSNGQVTGGSGGYDGTNGNELFAHQMTVTTAPISQSIQNGQSATFGIVVQADEATSYSNGTPIYGTPGNANNTGVTYQWYIGDPNNGGTPLSNIGVYSGADTENLTISDVTGLNGTQYYIKVTHSKKVCIEEIENATLSVNVPTATDDSVATDEETTKNINFLTNDTFGNDGPNVNDPITLPTNTSAEGGIIAINDGGTPNDPLDDTIDYTPATNFNGIDTFTYTIKDLNGDTSTATVTVTVNNVIDAPVAVDDTYTTDEETPVVLLPLTGDSDPEGDTLSIDSINGEALTGGVQVITVPNGVVNIDANDVITFTSDTNFVGQVTFPYVISDTEGGTATANQNITVNNVIDAPVAVDDTYTTDEETPVVLLPLTGDSDPEGDTLSIDSINATTLTPGTPQSISVPNGVVDVDASGNITFTPDTNYAGPVSFPYVISDTEGGTATANQNITVNNVIDAPVAVDDTYTTDEETPVVLLPLTGDSDPEGDTLSIDSINGEALTGGVQVITVPNGVVNIDANDVITFTPDTNFVGQVTFPYVISDTEGGTATANQNITVNNVIDAPVAVDDTYTTDEETPVVLLPLTGDSDPEGDTLSIDSINGEALTGGVQVITVPNGVVNIDANDVITFTPDTNFVGQVTFPYVISDTEGGTATANQNITVNNVIDAPVAVDDSYTTDEETPVVLLPLTGDSDPEGDTLSIDSINGTTLTPGTPQSISVPNGTVDVDASGNITFTPDTNYAGPVSFPYVISDTEGGTATANQNITVNNVIDAPVAVDDTYTTDEETPVVLLPLTGDSDPEGDTLSIDSINGTTLTPGTPQSISVPNGTVDVDASGNITFTPDTNYAGPVSFPYVISDTEGGTATANQNITVNNVIDAPVAVDDTYTTDEETPVVLLPLTGDSDPEGDTLSIDSINGEALTGGVQVITVPNGVVNIDANDVITFTPDTNFVGQVTFPYVISDTEGGTATANQNITVNNVIDAPVAVDDTYTTDEETPVVLLPLTGDSDPEGDTLSIDSINGTTLTPGTPQSISVPNGTVDVDASGNITFTPDTNYAGPVSFPYVISDTEGGTATANQNITVNAIVDAVDDVVSVDEDTPIVVDVFVNDNDVPTAGTITVTQPTNGVVIITDPNGTPNNPSDDVVTYTPNPGYTGSDIFTYTICDSNSNCDTADVEVTIIPVVSSIGDLIWYDLDQDGIRDPGEYRLEGVTVTLDPGTPGDASDDQVTFTDAVGNYLFTNLSSGTYTVTVDLTTTVVSSLPPGKTIAALIPTSDADGVSTPNTSTLTVSAGEDNVDQDFAYVDPTPSGGGSGGGGVSSGNSGGIESESLGDALTKVYVGRKKNSVPTEFVKSSENIYNKQKMKSVQPYQGKGQTLLDMFPTELVAGNVANITSPTDILDYTIADEVLSVDFALDGETKGVVLGIKTSDKVYNHTKASCDRLRGAEILNIQKMHIGGYNFLMQGIKQRNGVVEYAISFATAKNNNDNNYTIQTNWYVNDYTKFNDVYNFQVWSKTPADTQKMVADILENLTSFIPVAQTEVQKFPETYASKIYREKGELIVALRSTEVGNTAEVNMVELYSETANNIKFRDNALTTEIQQALRLDIADGYEYDALIKVDGQVSDAFYHADGNWGLDYDKRYTEIKNYFVWNDFDRAYQDDEYTINRNPEVKATSDYDYLTLYKALLPGTLSADYSQYNYVSFTAKGSGLMELGLIKSSIEDWKAQYRVMVDFSEEEQTYYVPFEYFSSSATQDKLTANDLTTLTFTFLPVEAQTKELDLKISNVKFTKTAVEDQIVNKIETFENEFMAYPNPSKGNVNLLLFSETDTEATVTLADVTGKVIYNQKVQLNAGKNELEFDFKVKTGVMLLQVTSPENDYGTSKVIFR